MVAIRGYCKLSDFYNIQLNILNIISIYCRMAVFCENSLLVDEIRRTYMNSMLEYRGYHAAISYDADDELFVGEVFGIVDSLSFHGSSIDELKQKFADCIENYLDVCKQIGKEPEKEFKGSFNVRIPSELHRQIAMLAAQQKITLNQYVVNALRKTI